MGGSLSKNVKTSYVVSFYTSLIYYYEPLTFTRGHIREYQV